jgi:pimeloyl-ACP methyl ester carboxylesterase
MWRFAGLAGDLDGEFDDRPPLVLLHGLTFDRSIWGLTLAELNTVDPGRLVLALDLPGHGRSPTWTSYDLESVAQVVHRAAEEAQLRSPVVVGHSMAAVVATIYASRYPSSGVVNVDQWLQVAPLAQLVRSLAPQIRGPGFRAVWEMFEASMHIELLPDGAQDLVRSTCRPRQELVTGYWRELLDQSASELADRAATGLAALAASRVPDLFIAGHELEPEYRKWLNETLPQASVTVWPHSGHFPHLAEPRRFAGCLAATARWCRGLSRFEARRARGGAGNE